MRKLTYEWLAGLREIVIDPVRCPLTFEEFAMKEYERDRDGNRPDVIPDGDDHLINAVRYAVMDYAPYSFGGRGANSLREACAYCPAILRTRH